MARIMFMANAPWCNSGYGVQGKHLVPRLQKAGHSVAYFAFYGLQGGVIDSGGVTVYPAAFDLWGGDVLPAHMQHFQADTLITLLDVWVSTSFNKQAKQYGWAWLPWVPIDHDPIPDVVLENMRHATRIVPYSRWGEQGLRRAGYENVTYVPHGVSDAYCPGDREEARRLLRLPQDAFVIGMVAANKQTPSRKAIPEQLQAFAKFHARHPNSLFYLHTMTSPAAGGVDVEKIVNRLGLDGAVRWTNQYNYLIGFSEPMMAAMYNAFDVLSSVSMNEGFGIPILEAQACGIPVITLNRTSMSELTWAGIAVDDAQPFWTPLGAWVYMPSVAAIEEAYETIFASLRDPETREAYRVQAVTGAESYHWDRVISEHWGPLLQQIDAERVPAPKGA